MKRKKLQVIVDEYAGPIPDGLSEDFVPIAGGLRVSSPTLKAADQARARLEGEGLVHRERQTFSPADLPPAPALGMLSFKQELFGRWPDEPLEKLGGLTPRQAATQCRQELLELIRSLEGREARLPREERYDFAPLRQELGL